MVSVRVHEEDRVVWIGGCGVEYEGIRREEKKDYVCQR